MLPVIIDLALAEMRSVVVSSLKQLIEEVANLFKGTASECLEYSTKYIKVTVKKIVRKVMRKLMQNPQTRALLEGFVLA